MHTTPRKKSKQEEKHAHQTDREMEGQHKDQDGTQQCKSSSLRLYTSQGAY